MAKKSENGESLLIRLGQRVRALRKQRELTLKELATTAGLSLRFIEQLEAGMGNIAVSRLATVANALGTGLVELLADVEVGGGRAERLRAEIDSMLAGRKE